MAATKRALWGALEVGLTDACKAGAGVVSLWGHPDQEEGPLAFAEKQGAVAGARYPWPGLGGARTIKLNEPIVGGAPT